MTPRCCGKEMDRVPEALGYVCSECRKFVVYEPPETQLQVVPWSPFGRGSPTHPISDEDARYLSGKPAPIQVLVPVTIEDDGGPRRP